MFAPFTVPGWLVNPVPLADLSLWQEGKVRSPPCLVSCLCRDAGSCMLSHSFKDFISRKGRISCAAVPNASACVSVCSPHTCALGFPEMVKIDDTSGIVQHLPAKERFSQFKVLKYPLCLSTSSQIES